MPTLPVDIVNRARAECGLDEIGDLFDGSMGAKAAIKIYEPTILQLLSAAHWNFARRQQILTLIGDISGQFHANRNVPQPWAYMYDWPVDCVHARYVPRTLNTSNINQSIFGISNQIPTQQGWAGPAPFIVSSLNLPNDVNSQWYLTQGHDPEQTRIILTNELGAVLIYTGYMQYPDSWDPLFSQAVVATLAARFAMPLIPDKKEARVIRGDNVKMAEMALDAARVRDGDEGWTIVNHTPDWIRARTSGGFDRFDGYGWRGISIASDAGGVY